DVILCAARRTAALTLEQAVDVAMKRNRAFVSPVAFLESLGDQWSHWTCGLTFGGLPEQTVLFAFVAQEFLCVLFDVSITGLAGLLFLSLDQCVQGVNRVELIAPDPSEEYLLLPVNRIEHPGSVFLHKSNRKRPVFRSNVECGRAIVFGFDPVHLVIFL